MKAIWNNLVIAESDNTEIIEGNYYFPKASIHKDFFNDSNTRTRCPWKGQATYYRLKVGEKENLDAAWCYENPSEMAKEIKNHVAFWKGVKVID